MRISDWSSDVCSSDLERRWAHMWLFLDVSQVAQRQQANSATAGRHPQGGLRRTVTARGRGSTLPPVPRACGPAGSPVSGNAVSRPASVSGAPAWGCGDRWLPFSARCHAILFFGRTSMPVPFGAADEGVVLLQRGRIRPTVQLLWYGDHNQLRYNKEERRIGK